MSSFKFKLDYAGVRKNILQADFMLSFITNQAQAQLNADEHIKPFIGFDRAKAIIYPDREEDKE